MQKEEKKSAAEHRLGFATKCLAEVFPDRNNPTPKRFIINEAVKYGLRRQDCPESLKTAERQQTYFRNKWKKLRLSLPETYGILPCYVNGFGGGYYKGNAKAAAKQLDHDNRLAQGIVDSVDAFAQASVEVFPKVEAKRHSLVTRAITKKS